MVGTGERRGVQESILEARKKKDALGFQVFVMTTKVLKPEPASESPRGLVKAQIVGLPPGVSSSVGLEWNPEESACLTGSQVILMPLARGCHSDIPRRDHSVCSDSWHELWPEPSTGLLSLPRGAEWKDTTEVLMAEKDLLKFGL